MPGVFGLVSGGAWWWWGGVVKVTRARCDVGPVWLRVDWYGETGLFTALRHTRPSRLGPGW